MSQEPQGNRPGLEVIVLKDILCRVQDVFPGSSLAFTTIGAIERAIWTPNPIDKGRPDVRLLIRTVMDESNWLPERLDWLEVHGIIELARITFIKPKNSWSAPR